MTWGGQVHEQVAAYSSCREITSDLLNSICYPQSLSHTPVIYLGWGKKKQATCYPSPRQDFKGEWAQDLTRSSLIISYSPAWWWPFCTHQGDTMKGIWNRHTLSCSTATYFLSHLQIHLHVVSLLSSNLPSSQASRFLWSPKSEFNIAWGFSAKHTQPQDSS